MKKLAITALTTLTVLSLAAPSFASTKADDFFQMGNIFATNKSYDQAIDAYMSAAASDPATYGVKANISVAIIYGQKKEFDKAAALLEGILKDESDYKELYIVYKVLGKIREEQKRPADAVTAYETYLRLVPANKIKDKDRATIEQKIADLRG